MTREKKIKGLIALIDYANEALEQEQNCSEIPTGSTTKTCRTCKNFGSHHGICEICKDNKCWTEQEPTTKNDLAVDCISRIETIDYLCKHCPDDGECFKDCDEIKHLRQMPSVTPQEPQSFKWCTDCKEYDQDKHCCHRYSKVIRDTVAEIRQEPVLDKISMMKSEIADSLEFWDYSPNNNPLARDMLETLTNFWGDMRGR